MCIHSILIGTVATFDLTSSCLQITKAFEAELQGGMYLLIFAGCSDPDAWLCRIRFEGGAISRLGMG